MEGRVLLPPCTPMHPSPPALRPRRARQVFASKGGALTPEGTSPGTLISTLLSNFLCWVSVLSLVHRFFKDFLLPCGVVQTLQ